MFAIRPKALLGSVPSVGTILGVVLTHTDQIAAAAGKWSPAVLVASAVISAFIPAVVKKKDDSTEPPSDTATTLPAGTPPFVAKPGDTI